MTTRLYSHPIYLEHLTPPGHPERPDRLRAIARTLEDEAFAQLVHVESPAGDEATILYAHPEEYVEKIRRAIPDEGIARLDADTSASPKSWEAAITAIGAANAAVDDVFSGKADNVFVASRPPGHHAETSTAMGFCLFNNAAIAARYAQRRHGAERVAIVDWDVHHGNGTQEIFWRDPSVLYCSTHQMPLYPGTGRKDETGLGNIVNAPLSPQYRQRDLPRGLQVASFAGRRPIPAGSRDHIRRVRCASPRSTGRDQSDRGRLRLGDRAADGPRRAIFQQPGRQPARRRLRPAGTGLLGRRPCEAIDERIVHDR